MKLFSAKLQTTMRYSIMLCCPASVPLPADVASHTQAHQHQVETYKALVHLSHTNLATIHEIDGRVDAAVNHLVKVQSSLLLLTVAACKGASLTCHTLPCAQASEADGTNVSMWLRLGALTWSQQNK